jgi:hypothetical protein
VVGDRPQSFFSFTSSLLSDVGPTTTLLQPLSREGKSYSGAASAAHSRCDGKKKSYSGAADAAHYEEESRTMCSALSLRRRKVVRLLVRSLRRISFDEAACRRAVRLSERRCTRAVGGIIAGGASNLPPGLGAHVVLKSLLARCERGEGGGAAQVLRVRAAWGCQALETLPAPSGVRE